MMATNKSHENRELRWLSFNERVLKTAENPHIPLMERFKFIGIFSSNLDEFYAIRVGSLHRMIIDPEHHPTPPGVHPKVLIKQILKKVKILNDRVDVVVEQLMDELRQQHVHIVDPSTITPIQKEYVRDYFFSSVRNRIFPILLNRKLPFPYLKHVTLYLVVDLHDSNQEMEPQNALIEIPTNVLPRYVRIPSRNNHAYYIMLDDIIRINLREIFTIFPYDCIEAYTIKITRDGEYDLTEEVTKSLYDKLTKSIEQRSEGDPVRFIYDRTMPPDLLAYVQESAGLNDCRIIIAGGRYHNARDMLSFPKINNPNLYFEDQSPLEHYALKQSDALFEQIEKKDYLLTLPYHKYDYLIDLLREASLDASVVSIKMTLYRVPEDSSVINALRNAARNGKKVTLFIELQARFDEKINMYWTEVLTQENNVTLIGGVEDMKVHGKICVITRKKGKEKNKIAIIGTGNFNEKTASLYCDHLLFTANPLITEEVDRVFSMLEKGFADVKFKHLIVSPFHTRKKFIGLIKKEIQYAKEGRGGEIVLKLNNLVDEKMIAHLRKAAASGVSIKLMIRGICLMETNHPKVPAGTIQGKAMIDRYLEHSRVMKFNNGGNPLYFIGSADWMDRNLDRRIEVTISIQDSDIKAELEHFLTVHWKDTYASFSLEHSDFNEPLQQNIPDEPRAQIDLYRWYLKKINN
jgi:polyphosphate kinase